jgi:F420H(2)-dependent biliverdin reductase
VVRQRPYVRGAGDGMGRTPPARGAGPSSARRLRPKALRYGVLVIDPPALDVNTLEFLTERHLATLTTLRVDGSPHVVAVGFTYSPTEGLARVITFAGSVKAGNAARGGRAAVCQVDGRRWMTLEGTVRLTVDQSEVDRAVELYTVRYRAPRVRDDRVALEITVDRILGRA